MAGELRNRFQNNEDLFVELSNLEITLYPETNSCVICNEKTYILKTSKKTCYSFSLGAFTLIAGYSFCKKHKYMSIRPNHILKYHSQLAMEIVGKNHQITYDLVVKVGELRYRDHHQLEEVQTFLKCSEARIDLQLSTIGLISKRYLVLCKKKHEKNKDVVLKDISANGGFVLHFDGSTEQKCGKVSFVLKDSLSGHVLLSEMIESENYDDVKVHLQTVFDNFGKPLVVVSDLRSWFVSVCQDVFGEDVLHILCHFHFLRTLKDLFVESHKLIQVHLNQSCKLRLGIQEQLKVLQTEKAVEPTNKKPKSIEEIKKHWLDSGDALVTYQYVLSWILKFRQDSSGKGIPFDLPYLDFFHRFMAGKKMIDVVFSDRKKTDPGMRFRFYYNGFQKIEKKVNAASEKNKGFKENVRKLVYSQKWFKKLRGALFMESTQENRDSLAPLSKRYQLTQEEASEIPKNIEQFLGKVTNEIDLCKNKEKREILIRLKKQTEKHHQNLKVPTLTVIINGETKTVIPCRTNNFLESSYRGDKSTIRRQTGRSKLPREFNSVGALLPYYKSMRKHPTYKALFDDKKLLAKEFAKLFEDDWKIPENVIELPDNRLCVVDNFKDGVPSEGKSNGLM